MGKFPEQIGEPPESRGPTLSEMRESRSDETACGGGAPGPGTEGAAPDPGTEGAAPGSGDPESAAADSGLGPGTVDVATDVQNRESGSGKNRYVAGAVGAAPGPGTEGAAPGPGSPELAAADSAPGPDTGGGAPDPGTEGAAPGPGDPESAAADSAPGPDTGGGAPDPGTEGAAPGPGTEGGAPGSGDPESAKLIPEPKINNRHHDGDSGLEEIINAGAEVLNSSIFLVIGLIIILFVNSLRSYFPTIIGIMMIVTSVIYFINNIEQKEYKSLETSKISGNIVSVILGISILINGHNSIPLIAVIWGISGLRKGTKGLNVAIYNMAHKRKFLLEFFHAAFELTISILLIYDPFEKIKEHLILLGIEMIINASVVLFKDKAYKQIEEIQ